LTLRAEHEEQLSQVMDKTSDLEDMSALLLAYRKFSFPASTLVCHPDEWPPLFEEDALFETHLSTEDSSNSN
jgi:hypothetical protein